jgi:hypothetical protein
MNSDHIRIWKEATVTYFTVPTGYDLSDSEENYQESREQITLHLQKVKGSCKVREKRKKLVRKEKRSEENISRLLWEPG